jgi:pimeloyl-ACP methyl ester carboxylesterase
LSEAGVAQRRAMAYDFPISIAGRPMTHETSAPVSHFYSADDGLMLHVRDWPSRSRKTPVVCLPGLARTAADFDALATRLNGTRRVAAFDYRGRGLSAWDPNPKNYDLMVENADILSALTAAEIGEAIFVGTSRGGIHAMILSATRPAAIRGVVLNDIGPVLEAKGLARIRGYVGKLPQPNSWDDATNLAKTLMSAQFTALNDADFASYARLTFEEKNGRFATRYDPMLMRTLDSYDLDAPLPRLWPQFEGLRDAPLLAIRGENSDLLSIETLEEMSRRHPRCETYTVPGHGHAPLLLDAPSIDRIVAFVESID